VSNIQFIIWSSQFPDKMACPVVNFRLRKCLVQIKLLSPPLNGGTPLTNYKYQFNVGTGYSPKWFNLTRCANQTECALSTRSFTAAVNLTVGDLVNVRAYSKNSIGWSNPSLGCATEVPAARSKAPSLKINMKDQTMTAKWKKCTGKSCTYEIFWGIAGYTRQSLHITNRYQLTHVIPDVVKGQNYRFCIRANDCGITRNEYNCVNLVATSGTEIDQDLTMSKTWKGASVERDSSPEIKREVVISEKRCYWETLEVCFKRQRRQDFRDLSKFELASTDEGCEGLTVRSDETPNYAQFCSKVDLNGGILTDITSFIGTDVILGLKVSLDSGH